MWLEEWDQLLRVLTIGLPIYVVTIALLRVIGTRALSRMNAFDSVVTFALGSALAAAIITQELPGALALASILLLLLVQFAVSWLAVRIPAVERLTKSTPRLVLFRGRLREDAMRQARLSPDAVRAAVRARGMPRIEEVYAVVLETDGSLSVLPHGDGSQEATALHGVAGMREVA